MNPEFCSAAAEAGRDHALAHHCLQMARFSMAIAIEMGLDAKVVRSLLNVPSLFPVGSLVALSDGSVACVHRRNRSEYSGPIVRLIQNGEGRRVDPDDESAIINLSESDLDVVQAIPNPARKEIPLDDPERAFQARR